MVYKYFGKLVMPEGNLKNITYVLKNEKYNKSFNISQYFKDNQLKNIGFAVNVSGKDIFCEVGKIEVLYEVYKINGYDLGNTLWDLVEENIEIIINDDVEEDL
jgi:hypothetical protein